MLVYLSSTDPRLTDYDTLLQNIKDLKAGKEVQVPIYDFKTSSRVGYRFFPFSISYSFKGCRCPDIKSLG